MSKRMLVHDRRLAGNAPSVAQNTYVVGSDVSTAHIVSWVGAYARSQRGIDELLIMCHGRTGRVGVEDATVHQSAVRVAGSAGLQLGAENLDLSNVALTAGWKPNIRRIYLYACAVAQGSQINDPRFDGARFCGELALLSGAEVFASDRTQIYSRRRTRWQTWVGTNVAGTIDFGAWEGAVFSYSPSTGRPSVVTPGRAHR